MGWNAAGIGLCCDLRSGLMLFRVPVVLDPESGTGIAMRGDKKCCSKGFSLWMLRMKEKSGRSGSTQDAVWYDTCVYSCTESSEETHIFERRTGEEGMERMRSRCRCSRESSVWKRVVYSIQ